MNLEFNINDFKELVQQADMDSSDLRTMAVHHRAIADMVVGDNALYKRAGWIVVSNILEAHETLAISFIEEKCKTGLPGNDLQFICEILATTFFSCFELIAKDKQLITLLDGRALFDIVKKFGVKAVTLITDPEVQKKLRAQTLFKAATKREEGAQLQRQGSQTAVENDDETAFRMGMAHYAKKDTQNQELAEHYFMQAATNGHEPAFEKLREMTKNARFQKKLAVAEIACECEKDDIAADIIEEIEASLDKNKLAFLIDHIKTRLADLQKEEPVKIVRLGNFYCEVVVGLTALQFNNSLERSNLFRLIATMFAEHYPEIALCYMQEMPPINTQLKTL